MRHRRSTAFTLVELLVVITIIVILLSLLAPAMDQAVYQAELAVCGAHQRGIGTSVSGYAFENKRRYPHRPGVVEKPNTGANNAGAVWRVNALKGDGRAVTNPWDDRPMLKTFMSLELLLCPLSGRFDIDSSTSYGAEDFVASNYQMWFGWGYNQGTAAAQPGMFRIGDRFQWGSDRFNIVASDRDEYDIGNGTSYADTSHPDDGLLVRWILEGRQFTGVTLNTNFWSSFWSRGGSSERGKIDMNFLYQDLSVVRGDKLAHDDIDRLTAVPLYGRTSSDFPTRGVRLLSSSQP